MGDLCVNRGNVGNFGNDLTILVNVSLYRLIIEGGHIVANVPKVARNEIIVDIVSPQEIGVLKHND
jgi:hypothetical protein